MPERICVAVLMECIAHSVEDELERGVYAIGSFYWAIS